MLFANIFSHLVGCLFVLLMVSFAVQSILSLIKSHLFIYLFSKFIYLFIHLWLCWVFVSVRGPSPAAVSGARSSSRCAGLSPSQPLPLRSTGSRRAGSVVVAHGTSHSAACGILPDQGSNPCPLHWQADSQPLRHQGSPHLFIFAFISFALGDISPQILLQFISKSARSFMVSGLTVRSLIHSEFIFVYGVRKCSNFILLHVAVQFSQHNLLKRLSFFHCIFFSPLS